MRLTFVAATVLMACASLSQSWEKPIVPGLQYRSEIDESKPLVVNAFKVNLKSGVRLSPELSQGRVYAQDATKGRETLSEAILRTGALAGVNADFFPHTGDPLGLMVKDGELLSEPYKNRSIFAWSSSGRTAVAPCTFSSSLVSTTVGSLPLDGLNRQCGLGQAVLFTQRGGLVVSKTDNVLIVLRTGTAKLLPTGLIQGKVVSIIENTTDVAVEADTVVLCAAGSRKQEFMPLRPNQSVKIYTYTEGFDWSQVDNAIGGGPLLVKSGKSLVAGADEGFDATFTDKRHPRTALGVNASGEVWLVTCDGRQKESTGATLQEMSEIMLRLGCVMAMNLDGGGSTSAGLGGHTLNRPSDGSERPVSNFLLLFAPGKAELKPEPLGMMLPAFSVAGQTYPMTITRDDGTPIPNSDVIWWSTGPAWVDQGGFLHVIGPGVVSIGAMVSGHQLVGTLQAQPVGTLPPAKS